MNRKIVSLVSTLALMGSLSACSGTPTTGTQQTVPAPSAASTPDAMKQGDAMKKDGEAMKQGDAMKKETSKKP
ncbi:MAG: hypothetical protein H0U45_12085 [Tatlockia sp.]|nr:hypothetical protein [Tatlockia sp.]